MNYIQTTQKFLNYFLGKSLVIDGIQGQQTNSAIETAIIRLKVRFKTLGWKWNDTNFIGIRTDLDIDNTFDDWFVLVDRNRLIAVPASTVSGFGGIWKYWNRWFYGKQGVASIAHNQQINYLLVEPTDTTFWNPLWSGGLGFLYQDQPIDLYMGATLVNGVWQININNIVKGTQGSGHNVHSWLNVIGQFVNNLGEGCQVTTADYWKLIVFPFLKSIAVKKRVIYSLMKF
jgi:hypothetical protein